MSFTLFNSVGDWSDFKVKVAAWRWQWKFNTLPGWVEKLCMIAVHMDLIKNIYNAFTILVFKALT